MGLAKVLILGLGQISSANAVPLKRFLRIAADDETPKDTDDPNLWLYLGIAVILVLLGGAFAGLTIALMGQDGIYLQVIATSGEGEEQKHAQKVYRLLKKGKHWVLVTLLLSNVIVNETLPIVLDRSLGGGWPAVLGSTALIVIFGEVIPQSVCVRYGLQIGAFMSSSVLVLMYLLAPIAWPTAKLLDRLLGEDHGTVYKKSGLKTLVTLHKTLGTSPSDRLNQDEVTIISAVLDLKDKAIGDIMTPMDDVFTMSADTILDEKTMDVILSAGYSRIPIYEPANKLNFVGMLLVKILITYDPEDCKRVNEFALATLPETRPETSCLDIVNFFQEGKSHMVLVSEYPGENYGAKGVVTLEDVIEELIGEEIIDESDVYIDVHKAIRRMTPAPKARVAKGHIVADPDVAAVPEDHLLDIGDESTNHEDSPRKKIESLSAKRTNSTGIGTSPKTTFMKRSPSSNIDGQANVPITVRANAADMREHLKHLGPSNLASRPKSTRYNTVKIKQAFPLNGTTPEPGIRSSNADESYRDNSAFPAAQGGEGDGLLRSAERHASNDVQALYPGYGTVVDQSSPAKSPEQTVKSVQASFDDPRDRPSGEKPERPSTRRSRSAISRSDTVGSLPSRDVSPTSRKTGVTRSGSITENIINSGGVRKVILMTNSSSDDIDEVEGSDGKAKQNQSSTSLLGHSKSAGEIAGAQSDEAVKKQRKKRKSKKGGKKESGSGKHGSSS
ncbi:MAG: hypothetical protein M1818_006063 [Claussenomyces sp. TS43310]|nr:MAG: hypothetical protein M1818_006063 [Claussenomyces sp. TS43310]